MGSTKGSVLVGSWLENRRVGEFRVVDSSGGCHLEKYEGGERVSRERLGSNTTNNGSQQSQCNYLNPIDSGLLTGSNVCVQCQKRFFPEFNHHWACRKPKSRNSGASAGGNFNPDKTEFEYGPHTSFI